MSATAAPADPCAHENWTLREVASFCRVSDQTIRRWIRLNQFPAPHKLGRHFIWPASVVRQVLAESAE